MARWVHLCIDMQRMFAEKTPWQVPRMKTVSPEVVEVASRFPQRTIFTRFIPPRNAGAMPGMWQADYENWPMMTTNRLAPEMIGLVSSLHALVPRPRIFDKFLYSPWVDGRLHSAPGSEEVGTIVLSGGETDICVLAAALGAIGPCKAYKAV